MSKLSRIDTSSMNLSLNIIFINQLSNSESSFLDFVFWFKCSITLIMDYSSIRESSSESFSSSSTTEDKLLKEFYFEASNNS